MTVRAPAHNGAQETSIPFPATSPFMIARSLSVSPGFLPLPVFEVTLDYCHFLNMPPLVMLPGLWKGCFFPVEMPFSFYRSRETPLHPLKPTREVPSFLLLSLKACPLPALGQKKISRTAASSLKKGLKTLLSFLLSSFTSVSTVCFLFCFGFWFLGFFCFLGLHLQHMEVLRLGMESKLQLLAYATATATRDPSHVFDLYHSSRQCRILNPLSEARDRTCNLMPPNWIHFPCAMTGTLGFFFFWPCRSSQAKD